MTSTGLKLLALVLMLIDHIGEFIPGAPLWLRWLGRLSAPLFFYCAAQGLAHTHDRKKYLLRLYIFGVAMAVIDLVCNNVVSQPYQYISNNIFVTIFSFALLVELIELLLRDKKRGALFIGLYVLLQLAGLGAGLLVAGKTDLYGMPIFAGAVLGSAVLCEGGPYFVLLGVAMYWARDDKRRLTVAYICFSLYMLYHALSYDGWNINVLLYQDFQWMMVLSLPLMLLYNGKRGAGLKYLFYFFYPLHVAALYFIGNAM